MRAQCAPAFALAALLSLGAAAPAARAAGGVGGAVVKVFATVRYPAAFKPWTKQAPSEVTGSGVVIDGRRILTNAHVVQYASQLQVQASGAGDKLAARVTAIAPGIDLAVLELDDPEFFASHPPLERASVLPDGKDEVLAYGFPTGGASLSITKGIVSRIEFVPYNFPVSGLRIQIDAAVNPGNSGGPALVRGKMIGLAYGYLNNAQNISYVIPNEEIELFLHSLAGAGYAGKPALYDDLQTLENPALRSFLKLDKAVHGTVVHHPYPSEATSPLRQWDVITHIGEVPIDDEGMVRIAGDLRVKFQYLVQRQAQNGRIALSVLRAGAPLTLSVPVVPERPLLVPDLNGAYPPYFIYGPMVFTRATGFFLAAISSNASILLMMAAVRNPLLINRAERPSPEREELVLVPSPFFSHRLAKGYSNAAGSVLEAVNGIRIRSLAHLVAVLRDLKDEFVSFEFDQRGGESLVFPRAEMVAATEEVLGDNGIRAQGSPELLAVWQGAAAAR